MISRVWGLVYISHVWGLVTLCSQDNANRVYRPPLAGV